MELSIRTLRELAETQGWRIESAGIHTRFLAPNGEGSVHVSQSPTHRDLQNTRSHLRRLGLVFPHTPKEEHDMSRTRSTAALKVVPEPEPDEPPTADESVDTSDVAGVLDLALTMLDELTETYKAFEHATVGTQAELRKQLRDLTTNQQSFNDRLDGIEKSAKNAVQADQLANAVKELRADAQRATEAAKKAADAADPIAAFRAKLRS